MTAHEQISLLRVRVTPKASATRVDRWENSVLYVRVSAAPAEGAANKAVIELVSSVLRIPKSSIRLKSGASSRDKTLEVAGLSRAELEHRIAATSG
ncbi:MAG: DUF167 domain-containing protein [Armatimonadetes bacterium]|nr:DUF167 domain-containing protein [Armatimonadota bacterium]